MFLLLARFYKTLELVEKCTAVLRDIKFYGDATEWANRNVEGSNLVFTACSC